MSPSRRTSIDSLLRAEFREIAREIVAYDRNVRGSKDTAGRIAAALDRAYKQGLAARDAPAAPEERSERPLRWIEIPPRARAALAHLAIPGFGSNADDAQHQPPQAKFVEVPGFHSLDPLAWRVAYLDGSWFIERDRGTKDSTIQILMRLGLLGPGAPDDGRRVLVATEAARAAWLDQLELTREAREKAAAANARRHRGIA